MFVSISAIIMRIRESLGWCPHHAAARGSNPPEAIHDSALDAAPAPGTSQVSLDTRRIRYRHTQIGTVQVWASVFAIVILALSYLYIGQYWFIFAALIFLGSALLLFGSLTTTVSGSDLEIRFGAFGIVKRVVPLPEITGISVVKTPWYFGWGIRWTPEGPLYNIAGDTGIEVRLSDGSRFRIGTDEPEALAAAITRTLSSSFL